jgi:integrase
LSACEREKTPQELANNRAAGRKQLFYCTRDLAELLRGYFYTGARPGELAKARVRDLSVREAKLTLTSAKNKKGEARPRDFYLDEPEALEFFKNMAQGKSPDQYLMTRADGAPWVNEKGQPSYVRWGRGMRAAIHEANRLLGPEDQIPTGTVVYTARHAVITDLLSQDGLDPAAVEEITGTSYQMIKQNYYKGSSPTGEGEACKTAVVLAVKECPIDPWALSEVDRPVTKAVGSLVGIGRLTVGYPEIEAGDEVKRVAQICGTHTSERGLEAIFGLFVNRSCALPRPMAS